MELEAGALVPDELGADAGAEAGAAVAAGVADSVLASVEVFESDAFDSDPESEEGSLLLAA